MKSIYPAISRFFSQSLAIQTYNSYTLLISSFWLLCTIKNENKIKLWSMPNQSRSNKNNVTMDWN